MSFDFNNLFRVSNRLIQLILLLSLSSVTNADPKTITIGADPWCPYNCDPAAEAQGLMVDIAKEALALSWFSLEYQVINWARAKRLVQSGQLDGIIGMVRTDSSEPLYFFTDTPLGQSQICFYRRADDDWVYQSIESLGKRKFGWINDYRFGGNLAMDRWVDEHIENGQVVTISGTDLHQRLIKLLQINRIDTFAEDKNVITYELKKSGLEKQIKISGCMKLVENVHLAFSLKSQNKENWAKALESGIDQLDKNGRLNEILSFYGLTKESWLDPRFYPPVQTIPNILP